MNKRFPLVGTGSSKGGFRGGGFKSGVTKFIQLTDGPHSYTGQGGKVVNVKSDESGLEFTTEAAIDRHDVKASSGDTDPSFLENKILVSEPLLQQTVAYPGGLFLNIYNNPLFGGYATFLPPVDMFYDPTGGLPTDPPQNTRLISIATAYGWTTNYIYRYDTETGWEEIIPSDGVLLYDKDSKYFYFWNGLEWGRFRSRYWIDPVLSIEVTPPVSPSEGERYIVGKDATGVWFGFDDFVAEYKSSVWHFTAPVVGMVVYAHADLYAYVSGDGTFWLQIAGNHYIGGQMHQASPIADIQSQVTDGKLITTDPAEISTLTEKSALVKNDLFIVEDSEDTNAKKKSTFDDLGFAIVAEANGATEEADAFTRGARIVIRTDLL